MLLLLRVCNSKVGHSPPPEPGLEVLLELI
jgi:hypothetical protein